MQLRFHHFVLAVGIFIFFGFTADKFHQQFVVGNSLTGKVRATQKPDHFYEGCFCHMPDGVQPGPFAQVQAWISGRDTLRVGETAIFTLYGTKDSLIAGGFNIATFFGTLDTLSAGMRIEDGELTHTFPKVAQGDTMLGNSDTLLQTRPVAIRFTLISAPSTPATTPTATTGTTRRSSS